MPATDILAFRDGTGCIPIQEWLQDLECHHKKAYHKCLARVLELSEKGFDMRRPHADLLEDGVYELRASLGGTHYRILYFFCGRNVVILSHGITKEDQVPRTEIERARSRKRLVQKSPDKYTADFEI
jgi:hypothetical protein